MDESSGGVHCLRGCLTIMEHDADNQRQKQSALVVAPATTLGVGELVLLLLQLFFRLMLLPAMLTCHSCMVNGVRVVVLLAC